MHQGLTDLCHVFRFWYHVSRFGVLTKQQKRHSRQVRKDRFAEIIAQAQTAAARHNTFQLFQLINRFAPKQPRRRTQLRTIHGQLATATEEHAILCRYVHDVWSGSPTQPTHPDVIAGTPFSEQDVRHALESIPISKAIAPGFAPGAIWRALAQSITPWLFSLLQCWWFQADPIIPDCWRHGWLCWLPKPGKPPTAPAALRPIALQEPLGKALIGVLCRVGQSDSLDQLIHWPLWAYLPHRSTLDSLYRVALHCKQVRSLIQSQRSTPATRASQHDRYKLCGGVQLLVDMSRAFDSVDRNRLFARLHELGVRKEIVKLLTSWHSDTCYIVQTGDASTQVSVERGLRQGCKAAPWLWNSTMALILTDLAGHIDRSWLQQHTNLYADDIQAGDVFYSEADLLCILHKFAVILSMLKSYGLLINEDKSMILIAMTGTSQQQVRQRLMLRRKEGDKLRFSYGDHTFSIPVTDSAKYLGVVISYGQLEEHTIRHRVQLATIAFKRLQVWFKGRRGLAMREKLQLWNTCVLPIATYGIFSTGITIKGARLLNHTFTVMLRKVLIDHSYITRHSNKHVFQLHDVDPPYIVLWRTAERLKWSVTQRILKLRPHDLAQQLRWDHLQDIQTMFLTLHEAGPKEHPLAHNIEATAVLTCQQCAFSTHNPTTLRKHYATQHDVHMFRTTLVTPSDHMLHGLPQCKHCLASFTTWRQFVVHIERGCQVLRAHPEQAGQPGTTALMPLLPTRLVNSRSDEAMRGHTQLGTQDLRNIMSHVWGPRLLRMIGTRQLHLLRQESEISDYLAQRCCLCDQWVGRAQEMHKHLRLFHAAFWPMVMAKSSQLSNLYADESPCQFCRGIFQKSHSCNTWTQVSLLLIYGADNPESTDTGSLRGLQCEICDQVMTTPEELYDHLMQAHQLTSARWNQGRDSIDGGSGCAHCGQVFGTMESLRSHISQGRCSCYNPTRTSEPVGITDSMINILCNGGLTDAVQDLQWRLQQTLHCMCCKASYHRSGDLMLQLQCAHSQLWRDSDPVTAIFLGLFYRNWGCICNPTTSIKRLNHVCTPLKQMSMQFLRLPPHKILMPLVITEQMLTQALNPTIPKELRFALERALISRDLETLLAQRTLMQQLAGICVLCGQHHTAHDLGIHLREAHDCSTTLVAFFVQQLIPLMLMQNPLDHMCHLCDMIFNLPLHLQISDGTDHTALADRILLAQNHYKAHCPVALQLAIVLCRAFNNGGHHHDRGPGSLSSDPSVLPASGTASGRQARQGPNTGSKSCPNEAPSKRRRAKGKRAPCEAGERDGSEPTARDGAPDGQDTGQTRSTDRGSKERRHIHFLLQQSGAHGVPEVLAGGGGDLALTEPDQTNPMATTPTETVAGIVEGLAGETDAARGGPTGLTSCSSRPDEQCAPSGPNMPLSGLGSHTEETDGIQAASHLPEEDGSEHPGIAGDEHRGDVGTGLSCPTTLRGDHTLAPSAESSSRPGILADESIVRLEHLGADGVKSQSPQLAPVQLGQSVEQEPEPATLQGQEQGQTHPGITNQLRPAADFDREILLDLVAHACFSNTDNWCFANSAVISLLWTTLSVRDCTLSFWGAHCNTLHDFVQKLQHQNGALNQEAWFIEVLQCWGRHDLDNPGHISQQDAAEFVSTWLNVMQSPAFDMRWERRLEADGLAHKVDESASTLPLFLQFAPIHTYVPRCALSDLVQVWHLADGMKAALMNSSTCICAHVDRCIHDSQTSRVRRCTTIIDPDVDCLIPVFLDETLTSGLLEYTIVALQAHLGGDAHGHYRAAVRIHPTVTQGPAPSNWLLSDDWRTPVPVWNLPDWLLQNAPVLWLVRSDSLHLHSYADPVKTTRDSMSVDAMLALLKPLDPPA